MMRKNDLRNLSSVKFDLKGLSVFQNGLKVDDDVESNDSENDECEHLSKKVVSGQEVCNDCGKVFPSLSKEQEWRYYGQDDNRYTENPSRCHFSNKINQKNLF